MGTTLAGGTALAIEFLETRHVKAALSAMSVKMDRNGARGLAQLIRLGWFSPVHLAAQKKEYPKLSYKAPIFIALGAVDD
jgi:hypothetical protein